MIRIAAVLTTALLAAAGAPQAAAQDSGVTVLRGGGDATADGVEIVRGRPVAAKPVATRAVKRYVTPFIAAGETLWFRSARTGRLVACWVAGTGYVGRSAIRCTATRAY